MLSSLKVVQPEQDRPGNMFCVVRGWDGVFQIRYPPVGNLGAVVTRDVFVASSYQATDGPPPTRWSMLSPSILAGVPALIASVICSQTQIGTYLIRNRGCVSCLS
jgi:hypothetical protein